MRQPFSLTFILFFFRGQKKGIKQAPVYDSDDERFYENEKVPNQEDSDYYEDEVDRFHSKRNKILLDTGADYQDKPQHSQQVLFLS